MPYQERREWLVASRPKFDREHCDGCHELLSRGSLRMVHTGPGDMPDGWKALCRKCIRLREEAA